MVNAEGIQNFYPAEKGNEFIVKIAWGQLVITQSKGRIESYELFNASRTNSTGAEPKADLKTIQGEMTGSGELSQDLQSTVFELFKTETLPIIVEDLKKSQKNHSSTINLTLLSTALDICKVATQHKVGKEISAVLSELRASYGSNSPDPNH